MTRISPAQQVTANMPPVLFIHGDKDELVPLQQSQWMIDKMKAVKVPAELIVKPLVYDKDNYQKYQARIDEKECPTVEDELKN